MMGFNVTKKVETPQGVFTIKKINALENRDAMNIATVDGTLNRSEYAWQLMLRGIIGCPEDFGPMPAIFPNDIEKTLSLRQDFVGARLCANVAATLQNEIVSLMTESKRVTEDDIKKSENPSLTQTSGKQDCQSNAVSTTLKSDGFSLESTSPRSSESLTTKL